MTPPPASRLEQREAALRARFPWCGSARGPEVGEVLLASVDARAETASLWSFGRGLGTTTLVDDARVVLDAARSLVSTRLAGWRVPVTRAVPAPQAEFIVGTQVQQLRGRSFGAALLLSQVSLGLGRPVPRDVIALATIDQDGRFGEVDGFDWKVAAVDTFAPTVGRCFVARGQVTPRQARIEFVPISDPLELVDAVFGSAAVDGDVETQSRRLFQLAMGTHSLITWQHVAAHAEALTAKVSDDVSRRRLDVVLRVARRHEGKPSGKLEAATGGLPLVLRDRFVANQVQHFADTGEDDEGWVDEVRGSLPPPVDCSWTQLEVCGAVGRALAGRRQYAEAEQLLRDTIEAWFESGQPLQSARAMSEWVRVLGITRSSLLGELAQSRALELLPILRTENEWSAAAFLAHAMGRALATQRRPIEANAWWMEAEQTRERPDWLRVADQRWRLRSRWYQGDASALDGLRGLAKDGGSDIHALAGLDADFFDGRDTHAALNVFLDTDGKRETARLRHGADHSEEVRRLVEESPY